jgi:hypothetical protein
MTSDYDACENVHLDHVVSEYNGGWGVLVDTVERNASTGFLHMKRCKLQQNKGGGLNMARKLLIFQLTHWFIPVASWIKVAQSSFHSKTPQNWIVRNDTGQTLNLKGRTGNAISMAPSTVKTVFAEGMNLYG